MAVKGLDRGLQDNKKRHEGDKGIYSLYRIKFLKKKKKNIRLLGLFQTLIRKMVESEIDTPITHGHDHVILWNGTQTTITSIGVKVGFGYRAPLLVVVNTYGNFRHTGTLQLLQIATSFCNEIKTN